MEYFFHSEYDRIKMLTYVSVSYDFCEKKVLVCLCQKEQLVRRYMPYYKDNAVLFCHVIFLYIWLPCHIKLRFYLIGQEDWVANVNLVSFNDIDVPFRKRFTNKVQKHDLYVSSSNNKN